MTHEGARVWLLELKRERMRNALGKLDSVTPVQAFQALGHPVERYDASKAEQVCALLAGLGYLPGRGEAWVR
jgi:hypothetical protein